MEQNSSNISFNEILSCLLAHKRTFFLTAIITFLVSAIIAFSIPKQYTTKVTLAPESSTSLSLGEGLGMLTSMVGLQANGANADAIFPDIYPDVIRSTTFLIDLSSMKVQTQDKSLVTTLYDYIENHQKEPWWFSVFSIFKSEKKQEKDHLDKFHLTKEQAVIIQTIENSISCRVDQSSGLITIKASAQDPFISAILADSVSVRLQNYITTYRTNKARNDLANIQKLYQEAKSKYDKTRMLYASYSDANQDLVLESYRAKANELENEMQLQYNIYTQVTTQLQMAKAKLIEKTPVYAVIQPATVPYRASSPKKMIICIVSLFVALAGYSTYLLVKLYSDRISKS